MMRHSIKISNINTARKWCNGTFAAPFLAMLLLSACQSNAKRLETKQSQLQQWVGQGEGVLRAHWGAPHNIYPTADGQGHFLTYQHVSATTTHIPADCERDLFGRKFCMLGESIMQQHICQQRFEIRSGHIQGAVLEGEGC
ncbi:MAG: hypothetical protein JNK86_04385 [Alphaproteobacteria bacterium]|nr:hypothetical protein [Alphaproteobacteria bacterium]